MLYQNVVDDMEQKRKYMFDDARLSHTLPHWYVDKIKKEQDKLMLIEAFRNVKYKEQKRKFACLSITSIVIITILFCLLIIL
ncbi:MAG: hypothetical protein KatS3mg083_091 [Candidatus Dojkabacteria bacterium]|nr:MAG: hypothetical protein KatS3mg083_091 [Candidatus Dojkabacteria bacterium]